MGRPTEYKPEYCQQLVDFYHVDSTHTGKKIITLKSGTVIEEDVELPNRPVHVVDFCDKINVTTTTFYNWLKAYPEFLDAYAHAKSYLERNIVDNALLGNYNGGFASLVSKNWLGWVDKAEITGKDGGAIKQEQTIKFDWSKVTDEDMEGIVKTAEKYLSTL